MLARTPLLAPLLLIAAVTTAVPASAYTWPGQSASPGGAISAKVIGERCDAILSSYEVGEVDAYLAKTRREMAMRPDASGSTEKAAAEYDDFVSRLSANYVQSFTDGKACDASAAEEARDMLNRVRIALMSAAPLFPGESDPNRKPDIAEAVTARLTAENCRADFKATDVAALDLYMATIWTRWLKNTAESDARVTMDLYRKLERDQLASWSDANCTTDAIAKSRHTLSLVRKP